jgi:chromosome segregation ATPase
LLRFPFESVFLIQRLMVTSELSDKQSEKSKKVADDLREEQDKVVKNLLGEMGLTPKEVETILAPAGGPTSEAPRPEAATTPTPAPKEEEPSASVEPAREEGMVEEEIVTSTPSIEQMFKKLDEMANTVQSLERNIAASLSAQLLEFRRALVDLRTEIAKKLTERLRMKAFAPLVENAISEVVVTEVKKLEESLLESFSKELVGKFKGFREELTSSKYRLLASIKEQAEIYGAHGKSLEDELTVYERQVREFKEQVAKQEAIIGEQRATVIDLQSDVVRLEGELSEAASGAKTGVEVRELKARLESQQQTIERLRTQIIETSEIKARLSAYEDNIEEKRRKAEELNGRIMELEAKLAETQVRAGDLEAQNKSLRTEVERIRTESVDVMKAKSRAIELETAYQRAKQEVQDLKSIVEETEDRLNAKKAEVVRIVKVMSKEPKYKILTILKDLGTLNFNEIARAIGQPIAIAKRYSQELQTDGYVRIDDQNVTGVDEWAKRAPSTSS